VGERCRGRGGGVSDAQCTAMASLGKEVATKALVMGTFRFNARRSLNAASRFLASLISV
jgi:hypothetical protein